MTERLPEAPGYRFLRRLAARSGQAELFEGVREAAPGRPETPVALKVPLRVHPDDEREARVRCEREVLFTGRSVHPNVVCLHEAGWCADGRRFLAMEWLVGPTVHEFVARQSAPVPAAVACEVVRQAALGVDYLHRARIVHRDLKPRNLMFDWQGVLKVIDLGLARVLYRIDSDGVTLASQFVGTLDYVAPEQLRDSAQADEKADLCGLGGVLHYLLTGRPPFVGGPARLTRSTPCDTPCPRLWRPDLDGELAALVRGLLESDPARRQPETAGGLAEVLRKWADESAAKVLLGVVPPGPPGPAVFPPSWPSRSADGPEDGPSTDGMPFASPDWRADSVEEDTWPTAAPAGSIFTSGRPEPRPAPAVPDETPGDDPIEGSIFSPGRARPAPAPERPPPARGGDDPIEGSIFCPRPR